VPRVVSRPRYRLESVEIPRSERLTEVPSLDGRTFRSASAVEGGEVDTDTVFRFHQEGEVVYAQYAGGKVRLGFLVGRIEDDRLEFRYAQLNMTGETSTGHSTDQVEILPDGRVLLHETWEWESRPGSGTSLLEEVP
jgi:hypothetical protein